MGKGLEGADPSVVRTQNDPVEKGGSPTDDEDWFRGPLTPTVTDLTFVNAEGKIEFTDEVRRYIESLTDDGSPWDEKLLKIGQILIEKYYNIEITEYPSADNGFCFRTSSDYPDLKPMFSRSFVIRELKFWKETDNLQFPENMPSSGDTRSYDGDPTLSASPDSRQIEIYKEDIAHARTFDELNIVIRGMYKIYDPALDVVYDKEKVIYEIELYRNTPDADPFHIPDVYGIREKVVQLKITEQAEKQVNLLKPEPPPVDIKSDIDRAFAYVDRLNEDGVSRFEVFSHELIVGLEACGYVIHRDKTAREKISITDPAIPKSTLSVSVREAIELIQASEAYQDYKIRTVGMSGDSDSVDERPIPWFENFHLSEAELSSIDGYKSLKAPQRKLLFENFNQIVLGKIEDDVALLVKNIEAKDQERYKKILGSTVGKFVGSFRSTLGKTYREITLGKKQAEEEKNVGFDESRKALLTDLIQTMLRLGPRVHEDEETGELQVSFVNALERGRGEIRKEEWEKEAELNKAAHAFAKIPLSWRNDSIGAQEKDEYKIVSWLRRTRFFNDASLKQSDTFKKSEEAYSEAKIAYEAVLRGKGLAPDEIVRELIGIDARVHQLQLIQTNPEALEGLASVSDRSFLSEVGKQFVQGPGVYMALGFAGRTMLSFAGSVFVAPLASASVGYLRSWNRSGAELRERDRDAVHGIQDTKKGALNVVLSDNLKKRLEQSVERVKNSSGRDRIVALASLRKRIEYSQDKQMLNRVNYGAREGVITRNLELSGALSEAVAFMYAHDNEFSDEVLSRLKTVDVELKSYLKGRDKRTEESRIADRKAASTKGAMLAYGLGFIGAYTVDVLRGQGIIGEGAVTNKNTGSTRERAGLITGIGRPQAENPTAPTNGSGSTGVRDEAGTVVPQQAPRAEPSQPTPLPRTAETVLSKGESVVYSVQKGDNLTKILSREMKFDGVSEATKSRYAYRFILALTPEELKAVGVQSGNPNLIYPNDEIDLTKLEEILKTKDLSRVVTQTPESEPVRTGTSGDVQSRSGRLSANQIEARVEKPGEQGSIEVRGSASSVGVLSGEPTVGRFTDGSGIREGVKTDAPPVEIIEARPRMMKEFVEGKIDLKVWEAIRGHDAGALPQQIDSIYGNTIAPEQRRLGILRKVFEVFGISPRTGESYESFMKRGMDAIGRDYPISIRNTEAYKMWMSRYESFSPRYNYADQNNIIRDNRAYVDAYQKWKENEVRGIRGAKPYPPPFFDENNYLKSVNPPLTAENTGLPREWRFETPTDSRVSSVNSNNGAVREIVFKTPTDDRVRVPQMNNPDLNNQYGENRPFSVSRGEQGRLVNPPLTAENTGLPRDWQFRTPTDDRIRSGGGYQYPGSYEENRLGRGERKWFDANNGWDVVFNPRKYGPGPASENRPFEPEWRPFKDYDFKAF